MVTWSVFVKHYNETKQSVAAAARADIRRRAIARLTERAQSGYADKPLCFRDLVEELERLI